MMATLRIPLITLLASLFLLFACSPARRYGAFAYAHRGLSADDIVVEETRIAGGPRGPVAMSAIDAQIGQGTLFDSAGFWIIPD